MFLLRRQMRELEAAAEGGPPHSASHRAPPPPADAGGGYDSRYPPGAEQHGVQSRNFARARLVHGCPNLGMIRLSGDDTQASIGSHGHTAVTERHRGCSMCRGHEQKAASAGSPGHAGERFPARRGLSRSARSDALIILCMSPSGAAA